jgi:hypothetical protein
VRGAKTKLRGVKLHLWQNSFVDARRGSSYLYVK